MGDLHMINLLMVRIKSSTGYDSWNVLISPRQHLSSLLCATYVPT